MNDPQITTVTDTDGVDARDRQEILERSQKWTTEHLPPLWTEATASHPLLTQWVNDVIAESLATMKFGYPVIRTGPSLLLIGGTGTGKTHQSYGALRALSTSGVLCFWRLTTAADLFTALRPRPGIDHEEVFHSYANTPVLVLDDLGATKESEWTEETLHRLVDNRYAWKRPTLFTSNIRPSQFTDRLGERIASRIDGMTTQVALTGPDRRRKLKPAS